MSQRILVLSSAESEQNAQINDAFVSAISQQLGDQIQAEWLHYSDIAFEFSDGRIDAFLLKTGQSLPQYDLVYFKSYYRYVENALSLVEYFKQEHTKFVCSELEPGISFSKLSQYARLTNAKLPIPHTVFVPSTHLADSYDTISARLGSPFVMKAIDGKGGDANYLIKSTDDYQQALSKSPGVEFVTQSFVPNDSDLRVLVLGYKVELIIKRQRADDSTHLNNTSQGGQAVLVEPGDLSAEVLDLCVQAARIFKREIAGVDLMFASNSAKPYILEVNASPQVASGAFPAEKVEKYGNFIKNMLQ